MTFAEFFLFLFALPQAAHIYTVTREIIIAQQFPGYFGDAVERSWFENCALWGVVTWCSWAKSTNRRRPENL